MRKLNSLHLLRAYPTPPAYDVEHRLIARLEDQLGPTKAGVVLEVGFPDAEGERVNEVRLVACRFQVADPLCPFRPDSSLHALCHEVGEKVRVSVPSSTVEPDPVAIISDARAVDLQVDDEGISFSDGDRLGVRCVCVLQKPPVLEELDPLERVGQAAEVR